MIDYGQFCTVARGAEVLCDRWTPLVVRELLCGSTQFNEIRRGVPRMSPTLLAKRLRTLEDFGVVRRHEHGRRTSYELTAAGEELRPIVMALGHWGSRWIGSRLRPDQLDAGFLMWDVRRFVRLEEFPADRQVVIHFHVPRRRAARAGLVAGRRGGRRRPVPRRPRPRPDPGGPLDRPRAHRGLDRRHHSGRGPQRPRPRGGRAAPRRGAALGLARHSAFAPSRHLRVAG